MDKRKTHTKEEVRKSAKGSSCWRMKAMVSITLLSGSGLGQLVGKSARLVIELRVRITAGAAGEFSSPELSLYAVSYSVSVPPLCYRSGT